MVITVMRRGRFWRIGLIGAASAAVLVVGVLTATTWSHLATPSVVELERSATEHLIQGDTEAGIADLRQALKQAEAAHDSEMTAELKELIRHTETTPPAPRRDAVLGQT